MREGQLFLYHVNKTSVMNTILSLTPLYHDTQKKLETRYDLVRIYLDEDIEKMTEEWLYSCEVVVTNSLCGAGQAILDRLPNLKLVANFGTGVDKIDLQYCKTRNVTVTHTPDVLTDDVAHLAFGLLISAVRQIPAAERHLRDGKWHKTIFPLTRSLKNMRVGILGLGRIGHAVASLCKPFGCSIAYCGPHKKDVDYPFFSECADLAQWADALVVSCLGGNSTDGLVSSEVLRKLGKEGFLINIARGSVVDEPALVSALKDGVIAGAGLDVFVNEPEVPKDLLTMDNVVLLPHVGSGTSYTRKAMGECMLTNVDAFFRGESLPNIFPV